MTGVLLPLLGAAIAAAPGAPTDALPPGRYGLVVDTATLQKLPFLGETPGGSRGWILAEVREQGGQLHQKMTTCDVIVTGLRGKEGRVEVPRAFIDAIPVNDRPIALTPLPDGGWRYTADLGDEYVGYDPAVGGLPSAADDPAVRDFEGDGHPGATMKLDVPVFGDVSIYVVQHAHITLTGELRGGQASGGVTYQTLDQATLGASHSLFAASPQMRPDPSRSRFELRRVDDDQGCADLRAALCAQGVGC